MSATLYTPLTDSEVDAILLQNNDILSESMIGITTKKRFPLTISDESRRKLSEAFQIQLPNPIPAQLVKGDTPLHRDVGPSSFLNTYLFYLTSTQGSLLIGNESYPITKGTAYRFSNETEHGTEGTEDSIRVSIGPFNEFAEYVGAPGINYYIFTALSPTEYVYSITDAYDSGDPFTILGYSGLTANSDGEPSFVPTGKRFIGWGTSDPPVPPPEYVEGATGTFEDSFTLYAMFEDIPPTSNGSSNPCLESCQSFGPTVQATNRTASDKVNFTENKAIYVAQQLNLNNLGQPRQFSDYATYIKYKIGGTQI
jgi:hypothetical protein